MKTQKKVIYLLHLPPPVHGSSVIGKAIQESKIINEVYENRYINLLVSRRINETGKLSLLKAFRFIGAWFKLLFELIKKKPDVCYLALTVKGVAFYKDVFLVGLLRLFGIKRIYHLHHKGVENNKVHIIDKMLYNFVFRNAHVILLSNYLYTDIKEFVSESYIHICPNGIKDNIKTTLVIRRNEKVKILFLSNLLLTKGVNILLEACSILKHNGVDFECDFVGGEGDISVQAFLKDIGEKGLANSVHYLGEKYNEEKYKAFSEADIFVLPTYNETFGLVNLEAMQFSLPVVSTYEGGIPDVVEDGITGFLVPVKDAKSLAQKIEILIKDPELRIKMGKAGRKKYEEEFTLDKFENRIVEILKEVSEK